MLCCTSAVIVLLNIWSIFKDLYDHPQDTMDRMYVIWSQKGTIKRESTRYMKCQISRIRTKCNLVSFFLPIEYINQFWCFLGFYALLKIYVCITTSTSWNRPARRIPIQITDLNYVRCSLDGLLFYLQNICIVYI